jgi:hypothetical protein
MNDLLSIVHEYRRTAPDVSASDAQRLGGVLGMLSSLEVKVLRPT